MERPRRGSAPRTVKKFPETRWPMACVAAALDEALERTLICVGKLA